MLGHHGVDAPVHAVASHDTASAFVAAPLRNPHAAILSSGTWSLLGLELDAPVLSRGRARFNLTNERGVDGTIRLLRNVMGLWLVQECAARAGALATTSCSRLARAPRATSRCSTPTTTRFLRPGDMPARIAEACRAGGQEPPEGRGEIVRSILVSLACNYRVVLDRLHARDRPRRRRACT